MLKFFFSCRSLSGMYTEENHVDYTKVQFDEKKKHKNHLIVFRVSKNADIVD